VKLNWRRKPCSWTISLSLKKARRGDANMSPAPPSPQDWDNHSPLLAQQTPTLGFNDLTLLDAAESIPDTVPVIVDRHLGPGEARMDSGSFELEDDEGSEVEEDDDNDMPDLEEEDFHPDFSHEHLAGDLTPTTDSPMCDLTFLDAVECAAWTDFITDYIACTKPLDPKIPWIDSSAGATVKGAHLSTLEQVIYGTNIALVAQWHLSQSAVQFNMTQAWNIFRYGVKIGQAGTGSSNTPAGANVEEAFRPTASSVRTLRSAERHLSPDFKDLLVGHAACSNAECQHVFYGITRLEDFKVGSPSGVCRTVPDGDRNVGLVRFPRMRLGVALERLMQIEGVEELCEQANARRERDEEFDRQRYPNKKMYRDAYSGSDWDLKPDQHPIDDSRYLVLHMDFGIDWYQPSRPNGARMQSIGPIIGHVTNLPQRLRASPALTLLLGITPGERRAAPSVYLELIDSLLLLRPIRDTWCGITPVHAASSIGTAASQAERD
jgi:hypothetical protein